MPPDPRAADLAALAWQVDLGADEAIGEVPVNRFDVDERPQSHRMATPEPTEAATVAVPGPVGGEERAAACASLLELRTALEMLEGLSIREGARSTVFADGNPAARLMVIGEAPGRDEDRAGVPFVGRSGLLLDRMLAAIGLSRHAPEPERAAYITNVLPWRPPQNRDPSGDEAALLLPFLFRHIALKRPEAILLVGAPAVRAVLSTEAGITRMRGRWHEWRGTPVMATFHPAALLRDPAKKREAWADLLLVRKRLDAGAR